MPTGSPVREGQRSLCCLARRPAFLPPVGQEAAWRFQYWQRESAGHSRIAMPAGLHSVETECLRCRQHAPFVKPVLASCLRDGVCEVDVDEDGVDLPPLLAQGEQQGEALAQRARRPKWKMHHLPRVGGCGGDVSLGKDTPPWWRGVVVAVQRPLRGEK